ncbi:YEATS protein [Dillenia turbinata]|uniref:YEATS protein n=1 Tax=Dillenia turbinata TaxID=194707 RepID=A0AAN8V4N1_9MAGN
MTIRTNSHKWTVYVRGATNEDLGVVIKRAVFQLHSSFANPIRVMILAPSHPKNQLLWSPTMRLFSISLLRVSFFSHVIHHPAVVVPHILDNVILLPLGEFSCFFGWILIPTVLHCFEDLTLLLSYAVALDDEDESRGGDTKDHQLRPWFMTFSEADELSKLAAARQQLSLVSQCIIYRLLRCTSHRCDMFQIFLLCDLIEVDVLKVGEKNYLVTLLLNTPKLNVGAQVGMVFILYSSEIDKKPPGKKVIGKGIRTYQYRTC